MQESKKNIFYSAPINASEFHELFLYFWTHGIGNRVKTDGSPQPWTSAQLESAFYTIKRNVDIRTIENWRAGNNIPSRKNLHALAIIASGGVDRKRIIWADAFLSHFIANNTKSRNISQTKKLTENLPYYQTKKSTHVFILNAILTIFVATSLFMMVKKNYSSTGPAEGFVTVVPLKNKTADRDVDITAELMTDLLVDALYDVKNLSVRRFSPGQNIAKRNSKFDLKIEGNVVDQENIRLLNINVLSLPDSIIIWSKSYEMNTLEGSSIYTNMPIEVSQAIGVTTSPNRINKMTSLGTDNIDAFISYEKGRRHLKLWHQSRNNDDMELANKYLQQAIAFDEDWAEPRLHLADVYHHFIVDDVPVFSEVTSQEVTLSKAKAAKALQSLLWEAAEYAPSAGAKSKAEMNAIFVSDRWDDLKSVSSSYVHSAVKETGEVEWLFEPIILLILNEDELLTRLIDERILKYDPLNGTGHAYDVRKYLLSNDVIKAKERLEVARAASFSNRLDQVEGYILFTSKDVVALKKHSETAPDLSPMYRDYFSVLSLYLAGDHAGALKTLGDSAALKKAPVYKAFAYHHIGETEAAASIFEQILREPLGAVNLATAISYGAACGSVAPPNIKSLKILMEQANSKLPACILDTQHD